MYKATWADIERHERLGGGGFGDVYRATRKSLGDEVAIKVLRDGQNPTAFSNFRREINALSSISHDGVVKILGHNLEEQPPFFIMPLMRGGALIDWAGELDVPVQRALLRHLTEVLQHIHQRGHLHRDLKPANILVAADGSARIADFGLGNKHQPGLTVLLTQNAGGTVGYMAPELIAPLGRASRATDVYALGATMFHLITGIAPYSPGLKSLDPKDYRTDVDEQLRRIILWMVHPNALSRPTTETILEWLGPSLPGAVPPRVPIIPTWVKGTAAVVAIGLVGGFLYVVAKAFGGKK